MARKVRCAERLLAALGDEGARWQSQACDVAAALQRAEGDTLLAAACLVYHGAMPEGSRCASLHSVFNY